MMAERDEDQVKEPRGERSANIRVEHYNNKNAGLVANTTGDYDEALRRCRQSVDLMPDASGYWDTLGRCYFAKKEFAAAVKYQKHAASLEPHSGLIRQQLQLFEDALKGSEQNEAGT